MSGKPLGSYAAFISYSHADSSAAQWLHDRLEGYEIPKDLVGRVTPQGLVPSNLRPVFRDRDDFSAGHSLTEQTLSALGRSRALIALCSPTAAKSHYVSEEIRLFKWRHPERPVVPVILDGQPGSQDQECFPLSLMMKVTADGAVSAEPDIILAADLRDGKDGKELGFAKIVAGLIEVPLDDVRKRDAIAHRRRVTVRAAIISSTVALAMIAIALSYLVAKLQSDIKSVAARALIGSPAQAAPGATAALNEALAAGDTCKDQPSFPQCRAADLVKQGKKAEALVLYQRIAEEKERARIDIGKGAAEAWRNVGVVALLTDPKQARDAFRRALNSVPDDREALWWNAWLLLQSGGGPETVERYLNALQLASTVAGDKLGLYRAKLGLGDLALQRKELKIAATHFHDALSIADTALTDAPSSVEWQTNSSMALERRGDVLFRSGKLPDALNYYERILAMARRRYQLEPHSGRHQRDISAALNRIGDVLEQTSNADRALEKYTEALSIIEKLAHGDSKDVGYQRDLSISLERCAGVLSRQADQGSATRFRAIDLLQRVHEIRRRLIGEDPDNFGLRSELATASELLGDELLRVGRIVEASQYIEESRSVRARLTLLDNENTDWQMQLSISYEKAGDVAREMRNARTALLQFSEMQSLRRKLVALDPARADWLRLLALGSFKVAHLYFVNHDHVAATPNIEEAIALMSRAYDAAPENQRWQEELKLMEKLKAEIINK